MIGALLLLVVSVVPADEEFTCTPTRVWDGDGPVWCKEGPRIRLAGIAAREIDDSCRSNQPCPTASGAEARDALVKLIGLVTVLCRLPISLCHLGFECERANAAQV